MTDIFLFKLILTFITGSVWVTLVTIIAEKSGTKLGGVVAGIPSTILIALFFIGWTQNPAFASECTTIIPIVMGFNSVFIVIYVLLARINFYLSITVSMLFWFTVSLGFVLLRFNNFTYSLIGSAILLIFSYYMLEKKLNIKSEGRKSVQYTFPQLLLRGIISGGITTFAVIMAKIGGPLLGGVFSIFPAVMLSTIIITYFAHGKSFSFAVVKVLTISGVVNVVIYAIAVRYFYLYAGLVYGTLISFMISLTSGYLVYIFVKRRMV